MLSGDTTTSSSRARSGAGGAATPLSQERGGDKQEALPRSGESRQEAEVEEGAVDALLEASRAELPPVSQKSLPVATQSAAADEDSDADLFQA